MTEDDTKQFAVHHLQQGTTKAIIVKTFSSDLLQMCLLQCATRSSIFLCCVNIFIFAVAIVMVNPKEITRFSSVQFHTRLFSN